VDSWLKVEDDLLLGGSQKKQKQLQCLKETPTRLLACIADLVWHACVIASV
jgi:hypothetical protein